ncbi:MAG: hypothetical protein F6J86_23280 [Symploca sp. SIO1B1]|nr:hypothetical protein [Symploca sp. SIO1B1]
MNAALNSAANIIRKVAGSIGIDLMELSRGVLTSPVRIRIWTLNESPSMQERGVVKTSVS